MEINGTGLRSYLSNIMKSLGIVTDIQPAEILYTINFSYEYNSHLHNNRVFILRGDDGLTDKQLEEIILINYRTISKMQIENVKISEVKKREYKPCLAGK